MSSRSLWGIGFEVFQILTQLGCRLPGNFTLGIYVPHRITAGFEFS